MAAQDVRTSFPRLPTNFWDARPTEMYIKIPASLFDTGTGVKTLSNLPKGLRILDAKITTTAVAAASYILDVEVNDGVTTTTVISAFQTNAINTARVAGTTHGEALLAATGTLRVNATTATTTNGAMTLVLTGAREVA